MSFYDAHCHLQDERIASRVEEVVRLYGNLGVRASVVNGTCEEDWGKIARLGKSHDCLRPSFGLHPWKAPAAGALWKERLIELWDSNPNSGVGEIGLDRWIEGYDLSIQEPVFLWQLEQAVERDAAVSIHCLRAWGRLLELLESQPVPKRGFLLHSYGGSEEMLAPLAKLGAYFSVSGYFALERKERQRSVLRKIPLDRLLIETDAPDMLGPKEFSLYRFSGDEGLNHPANIVGVYSFVAELLGMPLEELKGQVEDNFIRFFG
ncbi:hydrolase, TatD family [Verrucomicrobiia bacterium DG1235]|nr:hydrolase, TatD family [Verrucomicrobiae bacterium DG1235]